MGIENLSITNNEQKHFALGLFLEEHSSFEVIRKEDLLEIGNTPVFIYDSEQKHYIQLRSIDPSTAKREVLYRKVNHYELQDIYKWLYYGEFGPEEHSVYLKSDARVPELQKLLNDIKSEVNVPNLSDQVWRPLGLSLRYIKINLSCYHSLKLPLKTLENLLERSPAFRGTRVHFKLDWSFIKDYLITRVRKYQKEDFYTFEDRINFHQLPVVDFTSAYFKRYPDKYRVVPRKLFFDYFPEFNDGHDTKENKPGDSLLD
jgi:hypothetical protein